MNAKLRGWVGRFLKAEAYATAGDPGPVVLRRLNNAEYTYTLRDLTGVPLNPAREFPADGAAGEGFTNTGNALVMSPALLGKYLDAAKDVASHAVLLRDGVRFSTHTTRRDWTDEALHEIRALYARFADADGKLPLSKYLAATLEERGALADGSKSLASVAEARHLNARYLTFLWTVLNDQQPSPVLDSLRVRWRGEAGRRRRARQRNRAMATGALEISKRRPHETVGRARQSGVDPPGRPLQIPRNGHRRRRHRNARDQRRGRWPRTRRRRLANPRLVAAGRPDLPLRDVREHLRDALVRRDLVFQTAAHGLDAVAAAIDGQSDRAALAETYDVDPEILKSWLDYLGVGRVQPFSSIC